MKQAKTKKSSECLKYFITTRKGDLRGTAILQLLKFLMFLLQRILSQNLLFETENNALELGPVLTELYFFMPSMILASDNWFIKTCFSQNSWKT